MTPKQIHDASQLISHVLWLKAQRASAAASKIGMDGLAGIVQALEFEEPAAGVLADFVKTEIDRRIKEAEERLLRLEVDLQGEWPNRR